METLRQLRCILVCTLLLGLFFGCSVEKEHQLVKFYSLLEQNDYSSVSKMLLNEDPNGELCKIICLKEESKKKIGAEICNCNSDASIENPNIKKAQLLEQISRDRESTTDYNLLLERLDEYDWGHSNTIDRYHTIKYLKLKMLIYIDLEKYLEAEACIMFGFHLVEKFKFKNRFPYLYYSTLNSLQYVWTTDSKNIILQKTLNNLVIRGAEKNGLDHLKKDALYRKVNLIDIPDSIYLDTQFERLNSKEFDQKMKAMIASSIVGYLNLPEDEKLFDLCESILTNANRETQPYYKIIDLLILADTYSENLIFDYASEYIEEANKLRIENLPKNLWLHNYLVESKKTFFEHKYAQSNNQIDLDSALFYLAIKNKIADLIYSDKTVYHYNDILVEQGVDLMLLLKSEKSISIALQKEILYQNHIAKNQELKFQSQENKVLQGGAKSKSGDLNKKIRDIYLNSNDLTNLDDIRKSEYEKLYYLVEQKNDIRKKINKEDDFVTYPLKSDEVIDFVNQEKIEIVEYITGYDQTGLYHLSSSGMKVAFIDNGVLDSLMYNILSAIENKVEIKGLDELRAEILPFDFNPNTNQLIILKSGPLERFPFALFSLGLKIRYSNDLNEVLDMEKLILNRDSFWVQSFSDSKTIRNRAKTSFTELQNGYKSSVKISEHLGLDQDNLCLGVSSTFENFKDGCTMDGVHLITHGLSEEDVKNKNYLIFRQNENKYEKVSTVDLDYLTDYPKFIFLDACSTGKGKIEIGEGSYSIGRVFLKNGTSTIIKTLWKIDDKTAGFFSDEYYKAWVEGKSAFSAFQIAQESLKAKSQLPYHWAPFVLEGNPNVYLSQN